MIVVIAPELCQKCDFFLKKRMKEIFAYALEFMLTFDKMQTTSPLMYTKFEIRGKSILKVIQTYHTIRIFIYIGRSGTVAECQYKINMLQSMN